MAISFKFSIIILVSNQLVTSDCKSLLMTFRNLITNKLCGVRDMTACVSTVRTTVADWSRADEYSILDYQNELDWLLTCYTPSVLPLYLYLSRQTIVIAMNSLKASMTILRLI